MEILSSNKAFNDELKIIELKKFVNKIEQTY